MRAALVSVFLCSVFLCALGADAALAQRPISVGPETKSVTLQREVWDCLTSRLQRYETSRAATFFIPLVNCRVLGSANDLRNLSDEVRAKGDITLTDGAKQGQQSYAGSMRLSQSQFACLIKIRDAKFAATLGAAVKIDFDPCKATSSARATSSTPAATMGRQP